MLGVVGSGGMGFRQVLGDVVSKYWIQLWTHVIFCRRGRGVVEGLRRLRVGLGRENLDIYQTIFTKFIKFQHI